jgi:hypothetical protein
MNYFMGGVDYGQGPSADVNTGGLMDRLGLGEDKDKERNR